MVKMKKIFEQWGPIDGRPLYSTFWFVFAMNVMKRRWGIHWPHLDGVFADEKMTFYWSKTEQQKQGERTIGRYLLNKNNLRQLQKQYEVANARLKSIALQKIYSLKKDTGFEAVSKLAQEWYKAFNEFWLTAAVPEIANYAAPSHLENLLAKFVPVFARHEVLRILLAPDDLSFHQRAELELLQIFIRKNGRVSEKDLTYYADKWHWLENSYYQSKRLTAKHFLNRLRLLGSKKIYEDYQSIRKYLRQLQAQKKQMRQRYRLPARVMATARTLAYSIWWQDQRKAVIWWANTVADQLSRFAVSRFSLSFDDIMHYTSNEWLLLFEKKKLVKQNIIKKRKRFWAVRISLGGVRKLYGKAARLLVKKYAVSSESEQKIVKGLAVSVGAAVRGRVRIMLSTRDMSKFKTGEILVAPMTSPDYVPIMRKAKAIVTDVGGLMSHAAVVSRELKIPCIVGTKIATKVFKDGDWVEVDAGKGIVKKYKFKEKSEKSL